MPEMVPGEVRELRLRDRREKLPMIEVLGDQVGGAGAGGEDPGRSLRSAFQVSEQLDGFPAQEAVLRLPGFGAREGDGAGAPVDLLPPEGELLAAAQACHEGQADHESITRGEGLEKSPLFRRAQKADGRRRHFRQADFREGIAGQDLVAHGAVQEMPEEFQVVQNGLRSEPLSFKLAALIIEPGWGAVGEGESGAAIEPPGLVGLILLGAGAAWIDLPGLNERPE